MKSYVTPMTAGIQQVTLWITDWEVRQIFAASRCYYRTTNGYSLSEANGLFVREQRTHEGTLGFVYKNPIDGQNWLWAISKKTRKPRTIAKVG